MQIQLASPWINLLVLLLSLLLFAVPYIFSLMPAKLAQIRGETAWKLCKHLRTIGTIFMFIALFNMVLWIWLPIVIFNWLINPNPWVGIILGLIWFLVPLPIWLKGLRDAGAECHQPDRKSRMFGGIYTHIRHPQTLGEISWFIAVPLFVNSLFLLGVSILFLLIYVPIMIHIEEEDLIRRYGDSYREYKKGTGALIPKLRKTR
ncbi:MAG: methyltransferase family protein [Candidatus Thorarchaeota archaeon]